MFQEIFQIRYLIYPYNNKYCYKDILNNEFKISLVTNRSSNNVKPPPLASFKCALRLTLVKTHYCH